MAGEPQQKRSKVQSDGYKDRFLAVFPELVDTVTKDGLGSSEIGVAMQHFKSVSIRTAHCFQYRVAYNSCNCSSAWSILFLEAS